MHPAAGQFRQNKEHGASAGANAKASSSSPLPVLIPLSSAYCSITTPRAHPSRAPLLSLSPPFRPLAHPHPSLLTSGAASPFSSGSGTSNSVASAFAPSLFFDLAAAAAKVRRLVVRTRGRQEEWEACFGSGGEALVLTRLVLGVASSSSNGRYASGEANGHGEGAEGARGMGSIAGGGDRAAITGSRLCLCRARARSPPLRSRLRGRYPKHR
jgi:hypothetical protein